MAEKEQIESIIDSYITCKGECNNCLASRKFDGVMVCNLLSDYRSRLFDTITEIIDKM